MKNIKHIAVLALGLSALSAYSAGYSLVVTSPNDTIPNAIVVGNLGQSGVTAGFTVAVPSYSSSGYYDPADTTETVYSLNPTTGARIAVVTGAADPFSITSVTGIAAGAALTSGAAAQNLTVTFSVAANPAFAGKLYGITLNAAYSDSDGGIEAGSGSDTAIVAVPEPAQTIAGGMLLGIGGLVFASRRLMGKKAA